MLHFEIFSELKQIQNEKRRLLVETETEKLRSLDESFKRKFDTWRDKLEPRKQVFSIVSSPFSYRLLGAWRTVFETNARVGTVFQSTGSSPTLARLKTTLKLLPNLISAVNSFFSNFAHNAIINNYYQSVSSHWETITLMPFRAYSFCYLQLIPANKWFLTSVFDKMT